MPKSATLSSAVETATKWWATASVFDASAPSIAPDASRPAHSQSRARRALVSVSSVVKVFEATMNSVVSGSRSAVFCAMSVGSMFETKQRLDAGIRVRLEGFVDHHRAEIRPADADVDDVRDLLAGDAAPLAGADPLGEGRHRVEHRLHVVVDILPVDDERRGSRPAGRRSAVCSTARSSVVLMCSPASIAA